MNPYRTWVTREEIAEIHDVLYRRLGEAFVQSGGRGLFGRAFHHRDSALLLREVDRMEIDKGRRALAVEMDSAPPRLPQMEAVDADYDWGMRWPRH